MKKTLRRMSANGTDQSKARRRLYRRRAISGALTMVRSVPAPKTAPP